MAKKSVKKFQLFGVEIDFDNSYQFLTENKFTLAAIAVGLVFLIIGIVQLVTPGTASDNQIEIVSNSQNSNNRQTLGEIIVDVAGAVNKPGVYKLSAESRVATAIEKAGGFSNQANLAWTAKNLNLAAKLTDGAKIYIPQKNENPGTLGTNTTAAADKININTASKSQLESLPGIGPVRAGEIISARPYASTEELLTKKVIGKSTFDKIKDSISVF